MSSSSAATRAAAATAIHAVRQSGRSLDDALRLAEARYPQASVSLMRALAYGALRHYRVLDHWCSQLLERPLSRRDGVVSALLGAALFERWQLDTPAHAAVAESVNAAAELRRPRLRGLVNAILRRFDREREAMLDALPTAPAVRHSHPDWMAQAFARDWPERQGDLLAANNARAPMWLRVNRLRTDVDAYLARLRQAGLDATTAPSAPFALKLAEPVGVEQLPGFADGDVSVQDLAAQHVAPELDARPGMRVLDACAAPGGKTGHLQECAGGELDLVALDIDAVRLGRVRETMSRLGLAANVVSGDAAEPAAWWDGAAFDRILIDAPCSGSGVIRRHPDIKLLRQPGDVTAFAARQSAMLAALWPTLRRGGRLLYATCSILRQENHAVIERFTREHADASPVTELRGANILGLMQSDAFGHQLLTGDSDADGFFFCALRKGD